MVSSLLTLIIVLRLLIRVPLVAAVHLAQPKDSYPSVSEDGHVREEDDTSELVTRQGGHDTGIWKFAMNGYPGSYSAAMNCGRWRATNLHKVPTPLLTQVMCISATRKANLLEVTDPTTITLRQQPI